jgi:CTP synthase
MLQNGLQPDIIICRTEHKIHQGIRDKIALFCNVSKDNVIESMDAPSIYEVPLNMLSEGLDRQVLNTLRVNYDDIEPDLSKWKTFLSKLHNPTSEVTIGLVGKYVELKDAYKSISEAFIHAGTELCCKVKVKMLHSEKFEHDIGYMNEELSKLNGILVAPGFGERGIEGKLLAIRYARENNIPFFGICLGMQMAVVEFARNVLGFSDAHSTEMNINTTYPVISLMEEQKKITNMGGTMRLGAYPCHLLKDSKSFEAYQQENISERHRHRYEFNNEYFELYNEKGLKAKGINPESNLVEIVELDNHPYFVGVQFHPEYKSRVENPHPLFISFIKAAMQKSINS